MARALGLLAVTSVYAFTHDESAACYASRYPDLHARFCATDRCDTQALHDHYKNEGATEGRRWGCGSRFDAVSDLTARVPCRFVGGERHCDESKAVPCSRRRRGCFPKLLGSLDRTFGRCSTSVHIMLTPGEPRAIILWCCLLGARRGDAFHP